MSARTRPISIHLPRAKRISTGIAAYLAARSRGLSKIQAEAIRKKAREDFDCGASAARAVADAHVAAKRMARDSAHAE